MLCEKNNCTGCFSCYNACPQGTIIMSEDKCGYIYPKIDKNNCINCKLCEKSCPILNPVKLNYPKKCYAGRVKKEKKLELATSGGIATQLSEIFVENNGVVYGASFSDECAVNHIRVEKKEELSKLRGSKYVHSYILDTYKYAREDLKNKRNVLFIGTPCQIAGLKRFLVKDFENLFTVDIVCHGVPAQRYLKDEVNRLNNTLNIDKVNFRNKKYYDFTFAVEKNGSIIYSEHWKKSPYYYTFLKSITYRENCYNCNYARIERCSDLTLGDFWGIKPDSKFYDTKDKGISVILPCTAKGEEMLEMMDSYIDIEERSLDEAVRFNEQLQKPANKSKKVDEFRKKYDGNFYKTYKKVMKINFYKQKVKSNKLISKLLKIKKGN